MSKPNSTAEFLNAVEEARQSRIKSVPDWIPGDRPTEPDNYFITYFSAIREKTDVCTLYWTGEKWSFPLNDRDKQEIVLPILAWKPMPKAYIKPFVQGETENGNY